MDDISATVGHSFENDLIEALQPIRGYALAAALAAFFEVGLFTAMDRMRTVEIDAIANSLALDLVRLRGFLLYLQVEVFVSVTGHKACVTDKARRFKSFVPWYEMLIGGY